MSLRSTPQGYVIIALQKERRVTNPTVHRLVAQAFIQNFKCKPFINHKDGDKGKNYVENLEWCTHSENIKHAYATGLSSSFRQGKRNNGPKLTESDVRCIRLSNIPHSEIAEIYGVSKGTISSVRSRRTWRKVQ